MASRIKGITVEIGGDTTGLDKALKRVNSTIKNTQSELKDVQRLLKLDPSNTELLSQKQKALKDAIGATSEKLETLKEAQKQAKQQLENGDLGQDKYDALQREIIETEQELRRLQEEAATTSAELEKIDKVGDTLINAGDGITNVGKKVSVVSAAVAGLGAAAVKTTSEFDASMSQVAAVSGATGKEFQALRDKAREMGEKTKFSASEAADAMNYMAMAGWKTEEMLNGIDGIMNLAAASGEDLATTSDIVTDALTAMGYTASDSGRLADVMAAASSNANTNVGMMGETFKYAAAVAGAMGYTMEDVALATGLMANSGIKASQAGTSLRSMMSRMAAPTKQVAEAMTKIDLSITKENGTMKSFREVMVELRQKMAGLTETEKTQIASGIAGKNAMSGFLAVVNASDKDFEKLANAIDKSDGAAEDMASIMQDNLGGQLTILKSQLQELAISFGDMLMPVIRKIVGKVQEFVDKLNNMDEGQRKAILSIGLFIAALGPFLVILGTTISLVGKSMKAYVSAAKDFKKLKLAISSGTGIFGKLAAAISGISAPVIAIVAVIAVLIAAFRHLWKTNDSFRKNILGTWNKIKETVSNFCQGIVDRLNELGFNFKSITDVIKTVWDGLCNIFAPVFEGAFSVVSSVLSTVLNNLLNVLDLFVAVFHGDWKGAWEAVKSIFSNLWNGMASILSAVLDTIMGLINTALGWIRTSWEKIWTGIKAFFVGIWNGIKSFIGNVIHGIANTISSVFNGIKNNSVSIWNGIKNAIVTPVEEAKDKVKNLIDKIKGFFTGLKLELPHIKLPHFSITGNLSLKPPRVPKLSIDWYKSGGIMTSPTIFGLNGKSFMAGGEAGPEAILPLNQFYTKLEQILTKRLDFAGMEKRLAMLTTNGFGEMTMDVKASNQKVVHTGTIHVEGVNDRNEFVAAADYSVEEAIADIMRRQMRLA